jgi:hypothetical protein
MRRILPLAAGWSLLAISLSGCIIAPPPRPRPIAYYHPPPPVYYRPPPAYYRPPPPAYYPPPGVSIGVHIN